MWVGEKLLFSWRAWWRSFHSFVPSFIQSFMFHRSSFLRSKRFISSSLQMTNVLPCLITDLVYPSEAHHDNRDITNRLSSRMAAAAAIKNNVLSWQHVFFESRLKAMHDPVHPGKSLMRFLKGISNMTYDTHVCNMKMCCLKNLV